MNIDSTFLEISFDAAGIRDSQKRLKSLIAELAVEPLKQHPEAFTHQFELVEEIVCKRIANVIVYWCRHKHVPASPKSQDKMSDITNTGKSDDTLEEFYLAEVRLAMETLAETFDFTVPVDYEAGSDELEYALLELEEKNFRKATKADEKVKSSIVDEIIQEEETKVQEKETPMVIEMVNINHQK
jgi:hypothetical protein